MFATIVLASLFGALSPVPNGGARLARLEQLSWSVLELSKAYVDPARFKPREMLKEGLRAVENIIPDLLVDEAKLPNSISLKLGQKGWKGNTERIESIWEMYMVMRQALGFVGRHLPAGVDAAEVELAAVNGMLSTLDPHTVMFTPEAYDEMRTSTQGKFGGLGIVISQRDGWLTVISPIPGTPASRAGVRARDQIIQIGDETTANMSLEEAVSRLRGDPDTDVTVHLRRKGAKEPLVKTLTREEIKVPSVSHHVLKDGVGYLRIKSFSETTTDDAVAALAELRQAGATKGLVFDLRDNPGGLLDQAVAISDLFLSKGVIVTTVGVAGQMRQSRFAHASGSLTDLPIVVLISGGSASASEIVAGAIRNHGRGLLLGSPSFGKGSVQTIVPFRSRRGAADGSALKLTIAQYLTPGDISIQGTGIAPDIALEPVFIDDEDVYLTAKEGTREADLAHALSHEQAKAQKTRRSIRFLDTDEVVDQDERTRRENSGQFEADLPIRMAKKLLLTAGRPSADAFFSAAGSTLDELQAVEEKKLVKALAASGIDWSVGQAEGGSVTAKAEWPSHYDAGSTIQLPVVVRNDSDRAVHRVVVRSKAALELFDHREWVFGRVAPGESLRRVIELELPKGLHARSEFVRFEATAIGGVVKAPEPLTFSVRSAKRPRLAYTMTVDDGNDGLASAGETMTLHFAVQAQGVEAGPVYLAVRSKAPKAIKMEKARSERKLLKPGEVWTSELSVKVRSTDEPLDLLINLGIREHGLWYTEKVTLQAGKAGVAGAACGGASVKVSKAMTLRRGASDTAKALGELPAGSALPCVGKAAGFYRVRMPRGGIGYLSALGAGLGAGKAPSLGLARTPPRIALEGDLRTEIQGTTLSLRGEARDDGPLHNVVIYRGRKKVGFAGSGSSRVAINSDVELEPGQNLITLHAREGDDFGSSLSFWVLRREGWNPDKKAAH